MQTDRAYSWSDNKLDTVSDSLPAALMLASTSFHIVTTCREGAASIYYEAGADPPPT